MFKKIASIAAGLLVALGAVSSAAAVTASEQEAPVPATVETVTVNTSTVIWDW